MDFASIIGIVSGLFLVGGAILMKGSLANFFNLPGLMIVLGGTLSCLLLTFPLKDVIKAFKAALFVFYAQNIDPNDMVKTIIKISKISRTHGLVAISRVKTDHPLLKKSCNLIAESAEEDMIRDTLRIEIDSLKHRHLSIQDIFIKMSMFSPAFGMIGTIIGLVQMMNHLDDPKTIGPSMAIALLTTFYGVFLSTMFFLPIAGKLKATTMTELKNVEIIFEGAISILRNNNSLMVFEKLSSFIAAKDRTFNETDLFKL